MCSADSIINSNNNQTNVSALPSASVVGSVVAKNGHRIIMNDKKEQEHSSVQDAAIISDIKMKLEAIRRQKEFVANEKYKAKEKRLLTKKSILQLKIKLMDIKYKKALLLNKKRQREQQLQEQQEPGQELQQQQQPGDEGQQNEEQKLRVQQELEQKQRDRDQKEKEEQELKQQQDKEQQQKDPKDQEQKEEHQLKERLQEEQELKLKEEQKMKEQQQHREEQKLKEEQEKKEKDQHTNEEKQPKQQQEVTQQQQEDQEQQQEKQVENKPQEVAASVNILSPRKAKRRKQRKGSLDSWLLKSAEDVNTSENDIGMSTSPSASKIKRIARHKKSSLSLLDDASETSLSTIQSLEEGDDESESRAAQDECTIITAASKKSIYSTKTKEEDDVYYPLLYSDSSCSEIVADEEYDSQDETLASFNRIVPMLSPATIRRKEEREQRKKQKQQQQDCKRPQRLSKFLQHSAPVKPSLKVTKDEEDTNNHSRTPQRTSSNRPFTKRLMKKGLSFTKLSREEVLSLGTE